MTHQTDKIEVTENGFTLFEGYSTENQQPKRIVFNKNQISIYKNKNLIRIQPLISPFWVRLFFKKVQDNFHVSIENFGQHILVFRLNYFMNIPMVIEALSNLYDLVFFNGQSLPNGSEELIYHSIEGRTSRKIYRLRKPKGKLEFTFFDHNKSVAKFDLIKKSLFVKPPKGVSVRINFNRIKKILIYLEKVKNQSKFISFNLKIIRKTGDDIIVVNLVEIIGLYTRRYELNINEINGNWIFNAGMELMELLNNVPELADVPTEIEF